VATPSVNVWPPPEPEEVEVEAGEVEVWVVEVWGVVVDSGLGVVLVLLGLGVDSVDEGTYVDEGSDAGVDDGTNARVDEGSSSPQSSPSSLGAADSAIMAEV